MLGVRKSIIFTLLEHHKLGKSLEKYYLNSFNFFTIIPHPFNISLQKSFVYSIFTDIIFSFRRFFSESYYFLAESPSTLPVVASTPDVAVSTPAGVDGNCMAVLPTTHPGVPIHLFTRHVLERHAGDNTGFIQTFEHIESLAASSPKENVVSLLPHNVEKNRYKNVLACEYICLYMYYTFSNRIAYSDGHKDS